MSNPVTSAINHIGLSRLGRRLGCRPSNVQVWRDNGRLPQTDLAGLTSYAVTIEEMCDRKWTAEQLLEATRDAWVERRSLGIL